MASPPTMTQAYVFWHEPAAGVAAEDYEAGLRAFHERLSAARPTGLLHTVSYRIDSGPWRGDSYDGRSYEDWYVIADTPALDTIEAAAIADAAGPTHEEVARLAGRGAGGLYRLRHQPSRAAGIRGSARSLGVDSPTMDALVDLVTAAPTDSCVWLDRPRGLSTNDAIAMLRDAMPDAPVWQRRLVLGPATEFAVWLPANGAARTPAGWPARVTRRTRVTAGLAPRG